MPSETFEHLLDRASNLCGVDPGFWDIWGRYHETSLQARSAILNALGMDTSSAEALEHSIGERERREWRRLVPLTRVAGAAAREFPLNMPAEMLGQTAHICVRLEDGETHEFELPVHDLPQSAAAEMDGRTWIRKQARFPADLPLGYHEVTVRLGGASATMRYIVTPDRAWTHPVLARGGKAAGVAVSLYGVRSHRNWGCGDFRDLQDVVDWVSDDVDAGFVALNPLHAIHNRRPFNTSPYLPNCTFYQNFIYLDVEGIEDFGQSRRVQRLWRAPEVRAELEALRASEFVEYERVAALKLRFLKLAFLQFLRADFRTSSPRARQFRAFIASEGQLLERFATYSALDEFLHRRNPDLWLWTDWPAAYRDPNSPETCAFQRKHWRSVLFYQYLQWQIDGQLAHAQRKAREKLAIGLYHDLALATDRFGSDLWAHRPFYVAGCRVGSPPDDFAPSGQDWGFPPPRSDHHRETGYQWFADSIRKNCRHGGALRIDHVMRLFRLYWIPDGCDATQGSYVRERFDEFVRILALESVRNQVVIVGEDLGTVEPFIRETLHRFGILSYRLFYFERTQGAFKPHQEYPAHALVSSTTHDLPTIAGFWSGEDIAARRRAGVLDDAGFHAQMEARGRDKQGMLDVLHVSQLLPDYVPRAAAQIPELTGDLHNAIIGFLALTPSELLCVNQEDLTKEVFQQNLPATTWQYPNWSRKMRFTVEELRSAPDAKNFSAMLRHWIAKTGRSNRNAWRGPHPG